MRRLAAAAALGGIAALSACDTTGSVVGAQSTPPTTAGTSTSAAAPRCDYRETPDDPPAAGRTAGLPSGESAPSTVTLVTDHGEITMAMAVEAAPCTTASVAHLAFTGFYDGSPCHRLTKADTLSVLQCGDPTGTGTGGPGYTLPDENPTGLKPAGHEDYVIYPRGTVAMANTGRPNSGGSQFFLVYADSTLPPTYAVFATLDGAGLAVLDRIARGGVSGGERDGAPAVAVTIEETRAD